MGSSEGVGSLYPKPYTPSEIYEPENSDYEGSSISGESGVSSEHEDQVGLPPSSTLASKMFVATFGRGPDRKLVVPGDQAKSTAKTLPSVIRESEESADDYSSIVDHIADKYIADGLKAGDVIDLGDGSEVIIEGFSKGEDGRLQIKAFVAPKGAAQLGEDGKIVLGNLEEGQELSRLNVRLTPKTAGSNQYNASVSANTSLGWSEVDGDFAEKEQARSLGATVGADTDGDTGEYSMHWDDSEYKVDVSVTGGGDTPRQAVILSSSNEDGTPQSVITAREDVNLRDSDGKIVGKSPAFVQNFDTVTETPQKDGSIKITPGSDGKADTVPVDRSNPNGPRELMMAQGPLPDDVFSTGVRRPDDVSDKSPPEEYIGLTEEAALARAKKEGRSARVESRDGEQFLLSTDYEPDRLNLKVEYGIVTGVRVG